MYNIVRNYKTVIATCDTLSQAREWLSRLRKNYAADLPRGSKSLCRWHGKDAIIVHEMMNNNHIYSDEIMYAILEA